MRHHQIRRIRVTGGFLDGLDIVFTDGLNCIIGGRGTGKTTLQELIRYALGGSINGGDPDDRLGKLLKGNLHNGVVEVEFETEDGGRFTIKRAYKESPIVMDQSGEVVDPKILDSGLSISAAVFSQNEIETIASDSPSQRELLDRFERKQIWEVRQEIQRKRTKLEQNAKSLLLLEQQLRGEDVNLQELPALKEKLDRLNKELEGVDVGPEVEAASTAKQMRDNELAALNAVPPILDSARRRTEPLRTGMFTGLKEVFADELLSGPNGELFEQLRVTYLDQAKRFQDLINDALGCLDEMNRAADTMQEELKKRHAPEDVKYHDTLAKQKDKQARVKDRDALAKQIRELENKQRSRMRIEEQIKEMREERDKLLWEFSDACQKRYDVRQQAAESLNQQLAGKIRIEVRQAADTTTYADFLNDQMKGSGTKFRPRVAKVTSAIDPRRLAMFVGRENANAIVESSEVTDDFAAALVQALLKDSNVRYDLEVIDVDDLVEIQLDTGAGFRPTERVSTGQKCSAILPILLLDSVAPLLIDQPEDNLDNSYVSDTVVPKLKETQERRQMIFVTHNPNIPVLGEAKNVVVLKSDGRQAEVAEQGNLDRKEIRDFIVNLMEGGLEAFEERGRRYRDVKRG